MAVQWPLLVFSVLLGASCGTLVFLGIGEIKGVFKKVRFPLAVCALVLLAVGRICYSDFGLFYQVPQHSGLLYSTTQTIDTFVYRALLELNDVGRSSAAGFLQSILGFIMVFTANTLVSRIDKESALF